jgi:hypothetical protein
MIEIISAELASLNGLPGRELSFPVSAPVFHLGDTVRLVHFVQTGIIHLRHQDDGAALIEDNEKVLKVTAAMLTELGYRLPPPGAVLTLSGCSGAKRLSIFSSEMSGCHTV